LKDPMFKNTTTKKSISNPSASCARADGPLSRQVSEASSARPC
jgi:hypothetical protein